MIDHITIHVSDWDKSKEFYSKALAPLGYAQTGEMEEWKVTGYGAGGISDTWIVADGTDKPGHIAYKASSKDEVQGFYDAGLASGGKDNGAPGYRKGYSNGYYAAFLNDPDGHNIEVVYIDPAGTPE
jgi:catechol 2,3-dioxygenase-like lactoylglutathione lyase family enzyme